MGLGHNGPPDGPFCPNRATEENIGNCSKNVAFVKTTIQVGLMIIRMIEDIQKYILQKRNCQNNETEILYVQIFLRWSVLPRSPLLVHVYRISPIVSRPFTG